MSCIYVEKCKAFDRIYFEHGVEEYELAACAEIYKINQIPQYMQLQMEAQRLI